MPDIALSIDARAIGNSGLGVYLQVLLSHILRSNRFHVTLLGSRDVLEGILQASELPGVNIIECRAGIYSVSEQLEISCKIPRCDIFWSPHYNIPILPIRAKKRVVTIHDVYHLAHIHTLRTAQKVYAGVVLPLAARLSNRVITVSAFSRDEILKYTRVRPEKVEVIHNGVDFKGFRAARENPSLLGKYQLSSYILSVGNVKPHKNILGLIDAFALLHRSLPDIKLVIVGKRENFITGIEGLDEHIRDLALDGCIVFTGFVSDEDLKSLYTSARLFVFPSFYEGFGLPPLEAMAAGIPVVASRAASIPEICGDAVVYVDPHNPEDIAQGMIKVLHDDILCNTLVGRGLKRAESFDWQTSAGKHIGLFEKLCG